MIQRIVPFFICLLLHIALLAQQPNDTTVNVGKKVITLTEVVLNKQLNVPTFIERIKEDSTFYKAFRNLHVLGFTAMNDIRMLDKNGNSQASCFSKTKQVRQGNCRR